MGAARLGSGYGGEGVTGRIGCKGTPDYTFIILDLYWQDAG